MHRPASLLVSLCLSALTVLAAGGASAQQSCEEIEAVILRCPDPTLISGSPPSCACNGVPVEPLELTCAINFGCPTGDQIGFGDWPECSCRTVDDTGSGGSGGSGGGNGGGIGGVGGGLGGAATCEQFLECPSGSHMEVLGGQCSCVIVMLPAIKE